MEHNYQTFARLEVYAKETAVYEGGNIPYSIPVTRVGSSFTYDSGSVRFRFYLPSPVEIGKQVKVRLLFPAILDAPEGTSIDGYYIMAAYENFMANTRVDYVPETSEIVVGSFDGYETLDVTNTEWVYSDGIIVGAEFEGISLKPIKCIELSIYFSYPYQEVSEFNETFAFAGDNSVRLTASDPIPVPTLDPLSLVMGYRVGCAIRANR